MTIVIDYQKIIKYGYGCCSIIKHQYYTRAIVSINTHLYLYMYLYMYRYLLTYHAWHPAPRTLYFSITHWCLLRTVPVVMRTAWYGYCILY